MANQIARNLAAQGHGVAVGMTADHIRAFWDPRMKAKLLAMDGVGLEPIAAEAVTLLAMPDAASVASTVGPMASPGARGGSDAG